MVFPPKEILKKKKGVSDEEWLVDLKEWIALNGSFSSSLLFSFPQPPNKRGGQRIRMKKKPYFLLFIKTESSVSLDRKKSKETRKSSTTSQEDNQFENPDDKNAALQKLMAEQEELKQLLQKKHEEELRILGEEQSFQIRRHSSQSFYPSFFFFFFFQNWIRKNPPAFLLPKFPSSSLFSNN